MTNPTPPNRDEASWIQFLGELWNSPATPHGPGDDGCVLPPESRILSTDVLVEHVDFERDWAPPGALGHKALAVNLSDLAAMGARPRNLLLTLGLPGNLEPAWVEEMLRGMRSLGKRENLHLVGGDLTSSPEHLFLSLTVIGEPTGAPLLRSGGSPGDDLYVGGSLGGPRAALNLFQSGSRLGSGAEGGTEEHLMNRFFRPPPQNSLGIYLSENRIASACIDLSDGLTRDLRRLCSASGCGALIEADRIPAEPGLEQICTTRSEAFLCSLIGGEEQVLLFAVPSKAGFDPREAPLPVHRIGFLTEPAADLLLLHEDGHRELLPRGGYDHFQDHDNLQ